MSSFNPASVCCVISASSKLKESEGTSSGIIVDPKKGLILTHASLLTPLLMRNSKVIKSLKETGFVKNDGALLKFKCTVYLPADKLCRENKQRYQSILTNSEMKDDNNTVYQRTLASVLCVFECPALKKTLSKLIPSSEFEFADMRSHIPDSADDVDSEISYQLLPCFILMRTQRIENIGYIPFKSGMENKVGERVEICSTPFGSLNPDVFLNSRSCGIISNLAGENNVLILTDTRCIPGSEGAGLFTCPGNTCSTYR